MEIQSSEGTNVRLSACDSSEWKEYGLKLNVCFLFIFSHKYTSDRKVFGVHPCDPQDSQETSMLRSALATLTLATGQTLLIRRRFHDNKARKLTIH